MVKNVEDWLPNIETCSSLTDFSFNLRPVTFFTDPF